MNDLTVKVAEQGRNGVMEVGTTHIKGMSGLMARYEEMFKNAKVVKPTTLFEVEPNLQATFLEGLCPFCGLKLKIARSRPIARCGRKKCICPNKGGFVIRLSVLSGNLKII